MAKIVFLSGAGLSAPSGIRTFRDAGGMWEEYDVMEVCSTQGYAANPQKVHKFYDMRRKELASKKPNSAHEMIARLKNEFPDHIAVVTQNVDDLLERAGCKDVIHVHGILTHLRCLECGTIFYHGYKSQEGALCPACKTSRVRHHVVMFGESAPMYAKMYEELDDAKLLVCIGTSGQVINVAWMASWVEDSILNNIESDPNLDPYFKHCFIMSATEAAPKIEAYCRNFLSKELGFDKK